MQRQTQREYFLVIPASPLLYVYAMQVMIRQRVFQMWSLGLPTPRLLEENLARMIHNVHVAELDLLMWCVRRKFSFKQLLDDDLLLAEYQDEYDHVDSVTQDVLSHFHVFAHTLGIRSAVEDDMIMHERAAQELRKLVPIHCRRDSRVDFRAPNFWHRSVIDYYFDVYPLEEVRLPILSAIYSTCAVGGEFWPERAEVLYGRELDSEKNKHYIKPSWQEGETWDQTLQKDGDDIEPWMKL